MLIVVTVACCGLELRSSRLLLRVGVREAAVLWHGYWVSSKKQRLLQVEWREVGWVEGSAGSAGSMWV